MFNSDEQMWWQTPEAFPVAFIQQAHIPCHAKNKFGNERLRGAQNSGSFLVKAIESEKALQHHLMYTGEHRCRGVAGREMQVAGQSFDQGYPMVT